MKQKFQHAGIGQVAIVAEAVQAAAQVRSPPE
jgi:hypothetical protein